MIWLAYIGGGLVGLVVVMAVIGLALPRDHLAARRATIARPPAEVWRALTELPNRDKIAYEIVEDRPPELRITRIADDNLPYGGRWIYELAPADGGTQLTITEDGFIKNPVFRFLAATVFSTASTIERAMTDLGRHLGTPATIEPAEPSPLAKR
jgi:hypothetical protein